MVILSPLAVSCATPHGSAVFGPVGPRLSQRDELTSTGYLKVYSATEDHDDGNTHYFPHTGYSIYFEDGKTLVKKVANAISIHDEDPSLVQLPAGKYVVLARAEDNGMVRVAVIIQPGQLTKVNLEYDWKDRVSPGNAADLVRLPTGQVVGWRADVPVYGTTLTR
jgi:hypothetical protein